jgi:hypothetical protein
MTRAKRPSAVVWQEFCDRVTKLGGHVVEPEYLGRDKPHRVVCKVGHEVAPSPNRLGRGGGLCRACAGKDPGTAWGAFQERVAELGGRILEPGWLGCMKPHRVVCQAGHEAAPLPNTVQQGGGLCSTCAGNNTAVAEKAFRERIASLGATIVEPSWLGSATPHRIICAQGHEGHPRPADVARGHGICLTCAGKNPVATERAFRESVTKAGGQVLEPKWLGARKTHRIICAHGHVTTANPATVARGGRLCAICVGRAPGQVWEAFQNRVSALGGRVIEPEWLGYTVGHRAICREGHECKPRPDCVGQGQGICAICAGNDPATAWRLFQERVAALGGQVIELAWLGTGVAHRVVCREGHETTVHPGSVRSGQGICRFCKGLEWDVFYIVTNDQEGRVKFGVTSGSSKQRLQRLQTHRRAGYKSVARVFRGLSDAAALESSMKAKLDAAGFKPVQGREYFDVIHLPLILTIAEEWLSVFPETDSGQTYIPIDDLIARSA